MKRKFLILFVLFILLRLFSTSNYYFVAGDEARYLGLAKNFPKHTLYGDNVLFLQHGVVYPYSIHFLDSFLHNDLLSGLLISLIASIFLFFVLIKFFRLLNKDDNWICCFLLLITLSETLITAATKVYTESLYILLFICSLYFFLRYLKQKSYKSLFASSFFGIVLAFGTDKVVFLIPILLSMIYFFGKDRKNITQYIAIICICGAYAIVICIRLFVFLNNQYLPIGTDGLIENVTNFGIGQLLSPFSFAEGQKYAIYGFTFNPIQMAAALGYLINIIPLDLPVIINRAYISTLFNLRNTLLVLIIYIPMVVFIMCGLFKNLKKNLFMLFFAIVCSLPLFTGLASNRHLMILTIPLFYFFSEGFSKSKLNWLKKKNYIFLITLSLIFILFFISHNSFSLSRQKIVQGYSIVEYIDSLPKDGVFVQTGYSMEQAYLTNKKIYGLVPETENMLKYIEYFDINYIVIGNKSWAPIHEESIDYVKQNPERFKLLKVVDETYPFNEPPDRFYIYEIIKEQEGQE